MPSARRCGRPASPGPAEGLGILSLPIWTLLLIVTVKCVFFLPRDRVVEPGERVAI